jgi:hypothetical protein
MRVRRLFIFVLAATIFAHSGLLAQSGANDRWLTYHNQRFGTAIEYPAFFKAGPPPVNGDGLEFKSPDGGDFSVFAAYNTLNFNLAQFEESVIKSLDADERVTYKANGDNWFVISGTKGDDIFYERHLLAGGGQLTEGFVITYPARLKQKYDPIVARMSASFQANNGK